jgi:hypothetical protein
MLTMNEWMACIDAITFIFQARTIPINNEKKGMKTKNEGEREQDIYMHTSCFYNNTREFIDVYIYM